MRLPTSRAPGRRITRRASSAGADNRHGRDLDRRREGQRVGAQRGASVLSGRSEHFDQEVRSSVHHLGLLAKALGRKHKADHLDDLQDGVKSGHRVDLREDAQSAQPGSPCGFLDRNLVGAATCQHLVAFARYLTGDMDQRTTIADRGQTCLHVRGCGWWWWRKRDAELAQALVSGRQFSPNLTAYLKLP